MAPEWRQKKRGGQQNSGGSGRAAAGLGGAGGGSGQTGNAWSPAITQPLTSGARGGRCGPRISASALSAGATEFTPSGAAPPVALPPPAPPSPAPARVPASPLHGSRQTAATNDFALNGDVLRGCGGIDSRGGDSWQPSMAASFVAYPQQQRLRKEEAPAIWEHTCPSVDVASIATGFDSWRYEQQGGNFAASVGTAGAEACCWFNADAYSTESDDDVAPVRRRPPSVAASATTASTAAAIPSTTRVGLAAAVVGARRPASPPGNHSGPVDAMNSPMPEEWLERFASDGDAAELREQWRAWFFPAALVSGGNHDGEASRGGPCGEAPAGVASVNGCSTQAPANPSAVASLRRLQIVSWLLRQGLNDCHRADLVVAALSQLLGLDSTLASTVENRLAEYSDEDLADIALDNPRVHEFTTSLRAALSGAATVDPKAASGGESQAVNEFVDADDGNGAPLNVGAVLNQNPTENATVGCTLGTSFFSCPPSPSPSTSSGPSCQGVPLSPLVMPLAESVGSPPAEALLEAAAVAPSWSLPSPAALSAAMPAAAITSPVSVPSIPKTSEDTKACAYTRELLVAARRASFDASEEALLADDGVSAAHWRSETVASLAKFMPKTPMQVPRRAPREMASTVGARRGSGTARQDAGERREALSVGPNSWMAQVKRSKNCSDSLGEASAADEHVLREMRGTLNKLTVEKFDNLSDHLVSLIAGSTRPNRNIPLLMQLVFEKATTQHHFINMYVSLCAKIHRWLMDNAETVSYESQTNFKRILLNQCQLSFELYLEPPEGFEGLVGTELYEAQVKYKTKMLGNIKLVGELIRHGMLVSKIAIAVSEELVGDDPVVREERLETLAVFLESVGPSLDDPSWAHFAAWNSLFKKVELLTKDATLPCRIRFLLRNLLDLRQHKWKEQTTRCLAADAPTTIKEVHQKAAQQAGVGNGTRARPQAYSDFSSRRGREDQKQQRSMRRNSAGDATMTEEFVSAHVGPSTATSSRSDAVAPRTPTGGARSAATKVSPTSGGGGGILALPDSPKVLSWPVSSPNVSPWPGSQCFVGDRLDGQATAGAACSKAPIASNATVASAASTSIAAAVAEPMPPVAPPLSRSELLQGFHKEVANVVRSLGSGKIELEDAVARLRDRPLPADCQLEEAADLMARFVDEPRHARQRLLPLLPALVVAGVFSGSQLLARATESFAEDAFEDPNDVDPPDLAKILILEVLPILGVSVGQLCLPPSVQLVGGEK
eukprot:TRINITY_DN15606_c0_g4_i1.p1 TRINITY_DN15606_c0_g4~~TRINITY_DN15606_c0_g4_i1.p1  ORF type:complete len:1241 (-),score=284.00 TRINITY_DN15606_c0_g4_i1:102-3824(-)